MATATDPRRVDAHRGFKESNICRAKSYTDVSTMREWVKYGRTGNTAPKILRDTVLAANADAAAKRYTSTV
jgi:hypothetical protein